MDDERPARAILYGLTRRAGHGWCRVPMAFHYGHVLCGPATEVQHAGGIELRLELRGRRNGVPQDGRDGLHSGEHVRVPDTDHDSGYHIPEGSAGGRSEGMEHLPPGAPARL